MVAKAKNVELRETFIADFSGVFLTQSNIWDGTFC